MDKYQKQLLEQEFAGQPLPEYQQFSSDEINKVKKNFFTKYKFNSLNKIFNYTWANGKVIDVIKNIEDEANFDFKLLLNNSNIFPEEKIILVWDENDCDYFSIYEFSKYFSGLWHRSATDILIFDNNYSWLIIVNHNGEILLWENH